MTEMENAAGSDEAARAFEALCAEVAALRAIVEPLPKQWQKQAPADNSVLLLGQITKALQEMSGLLARIEEHPALAMTPAMHQQSIRDGGREVMRDVVSRYDQAAQWAERTQQELAAVVGDARRQSEQRKWLGVTAGVALLFGLLVAPFAARGLPILLQSRVAATVMGMNRWNAGSALMELGSPEDWREILSAAALLTPNRAALKACRDSALKTLKPKRCEVVVPVPQHLE